VFPEARIALPGGGTFTVEAPEASPLAGYVQSTTFDGSPFAKRWFTHSALTDGGKLTFRLGPVPNTSWATGAGAAPPSQTGSPPSTFGCDPGA
jgi:putative alpha-1,2-mannosidase